MAFEDMSEKEIVEYINPQHSSASQMAAQAEMMRRQMLAIRDFNLKSGRQATVMIWLTILIAVLTVAILILTGAMVWKG